MLWGITRSHFIRCSRAYSLSLVVAGVSQAIQAFGFQLATLERLESSGSPPGRFGFGNEKTPDAVRRPPNQCFKLYAGTEQFLENGSHRSFHELE
jgi:hypothetical protein